MSNLQIIYQKMYDSDRSIREQALADLGRWALETCLFFGVEFEIAAQVALTFVGGIRREFVEPSIERAKK